MIMDNERFFSALSRVREKDRATDGIGRLGERTLHAALKYYLEPDESRHEIKLGRYFADIVNEDGVIEIQTRSFRYLRPKLATFLEYAPVTVVYPVAKTKWLVRTDGEGGFSNRRKSPRKGTFYDIFYELYQIRSFLQNENLRLKIMLLDLVEIRSPREKKRGRKNGVRLERIPEKIVDEMNIFSFDDYRKFLPENLPETFTSADLAEKANIGRDTAQTALLLLCEVGIVDRIGKTGNAYLYQQVFDT